MSAPGNVVAGALMGLVFGIGAALIACCLPWLRRWDLASRIDPYLRRSAASALLESTATRGRYWVLLETLLGPVAVRAIGMLERLTGGPDQLEKRLRMAGRRSSVDAFRIEQVVFAMVGLFLGLIAGFAAVGMRGASPLLGLLIVALGAVTGILLRDYLLGIEIKRRAARMAREFPTVADLLVLAVAAGESPISAMERVARSSSGALPDEFAATVAEIRAGSGVSQALAHMGARTPLESLARFAEGVSIAIERGTPLADVLRAQAQDAREASKRQLMEMAGQREILMLLPVVFLVLPLVIVFAVFPGLAVLELAL